MESDKLFSTLTPKSINKTAKQEFLFLPFFHLSSSKLRFYPKVGFWNYVAVAYRHKKVCVGDMNAYAWSIASEEIEILL